MSEEIQNEIRHLNVNIPNNEGSIDLDVCRK